MEYPAAAGAVIGQHGFNLLWIGLVTVISSFFIWKGNKNAIFLAAICGGFADLGYFLFLDLGGFVKFVPGTIMTFISSLAIITSFYAHFKGNKVK
jgi:CHASE2 domain-containing sensor protein